MKHALHDAAEKRCRGTCPRISIASMSLALIFGLLCSMQAVAQPGNFFFTGFLKFNQDGATHEVTFENYGPWGQNVPIPGYSRDVNEQSGTTGLFHLSCSDPLLGETATVVAWAPAAGQPGLTQPPYAIASSVTIIDFGIERRREGASGVATCAPERPEVGKTADGSFDREYDWKIEKSATPKSADIFFGDSQEFAWTVTVQPDGPPTAKNHVVAGQITVRNVLADPITVTTVDDDFPGRSEISVVCDRALPALLPPAGADLTPQLVCSYSGTSNGTAGTNTATVTFTRGDAAGLVASATDDFDFTGEPANVINGTVKVEDSFDGADPAESLGSCSVATPCTGENAFSYTRKLDCGDFGITESGGSDSKLNTAKIVETGDSDGASVALTCWKPGVSKTAVPGFTREWFWDVEKTLDTEEPIVLNEGQAFELSYTIAVDQANPDPEGEPFMDSAFAVSGQITVSNPAPIAARINSVADAIGELTVAVDCGDGVEFPLSLDALEEGGEPDSLVCSYSTGLDDNTGGTNTATAALQNFERKAGGDEASGTTDFSGTDDFDFTGSPTSTVNACVDVIDLFSVEEIDFDIELLLQEGLDPNNPTVCYDNDPLPLSFTYTTFGFMDGDNPLPWFAVGDSLEDPPVCDLEVDNEAQVIAFNRDPEADLVTLDSSSVATTLTNAACGPVGCTLTIGYWKTHSDYGPAPYDETWALIGSDDPAWDALGLPGECDPEAAQCGEDTEFFGSGYSWHQVFWTPPAGDVYFRLAHQYMGATLNVLNGAAIPAHVGEAWDKATALFEECRPGDFQQARRGRFAAPAGPCAGDAAAAGQYASLLDSYNNGYEGVLHCSEDSHSDNDD